MKRGKAGYFFFLPIWIGVWMGVWMGFVVATTTPCYAALVPDGMSKTPQKIASSQAGIALAAHGKNDIFGFPAKTGTDWRNFAVKFQYPLQNHIRLPKDLREYASDHANSPLFSNPTFLEIADIWRETIIGQESIYGPYEKFHMKWQFSKARSAHSNGSNFPHNFYLEIKERQYFHSFDAQSPDFFIEAESSKIRLQQIGPESGNIKIRNQNMDILTHEENWATIGRFSLDLDFITPYALAAGKHDIEYVFKNSRTNFPPLLRLDEARFSNKIRWKNGQMQQRSVFSYHGLHLPGGLISEEFRTFFDPLEIRLALTYPVNIFWRRENEPAPDILTQSAIKIQNLELDCGFILGHSGVFGFHDGEFYWDNAKIWIDQLPVLEKKLAQLSNANSSLFAKPLRNWLARFKAMAPEQTAGQSRLEAPITLRQDGIYLGQVKIW